MRRKALTAEPLLMWHRRRKLVRSRGRPRLKLSPRQRRLPRPDQRGRGRSEPRPNRGPRAAPRARRRTLPPRLRLPLRAMQKFLGKEYRRAPAPWTWTLIRSQILKYNWTCLTGHRCRLPRRLLHSPGKGRLRYWRRAVMMMTDANGSTSRGWREREGQRLRCSAGQNSGAHATLSTHGFARTDCPRPCCQDVTSMLKF